MKNSRYRNPIVFPVALVAMLGQEVALAQGMLSTRMVEIEDRVVRVGTAGLEKRLPGQPVLVFENGAGSAIESWNPIFPAVTGLAPVFAYDRPGVGESEAAPERPDPEWLAEHLRTVLDELEIRPPYILVGHSLGGLLIHQFAGQYPETVAGLVYVGPADFASMREDRLALAESLGVSEAEYDAAMEEASRRLGPETPPGLRAESAMLREYFQADANRDLAQVPDVPMAILLAWPFPVPPSQANITDDYRQGLATQMQWRVAEFSEWVADFSSATLILATNAGHIIQNDDPSLVTDAIRRVSMRSFARP